MAAAAVAAVVAAAAEVVEAAVVQQQLLLLLQLLLLVLALVVQLVPQWVGREAWVARCCRHCQPPPPPAPLHLPGCSEATAEGAERACAGKRPPRCHCHCHCHCHWRHPQLPWLPRPPQRTLRWPPWTGPQPSAAPPLPLPCWPGTAWGGLPSLSRHAGQCLPSWRWGGGGAAAGREGRGMLLQWELLLMLPGLRGLLQRRWLQRRLRLPQHWRGWQHLRQQRLQWEAAGQQKAKAQVQKQLQALQLQLLR